MRSEASSPKEKYWLCLPDGTIVFDPKEEDYDLWRDEARDLLPEQPQE